MQGMIFKITLLAIAVVLFLQGTAGIMNFLKKERKQDVVTTGVSAPQIIILKKEAGNYINFVGSIISIIAGLGVVYYAMRN